MGRPREETGLDGGVNDILVVDDNPANLSLLHDMLGSRGFRVRPAPGGALALNAAMCQPPDLILLDINMPDMSGFAVCERLKADPALKDIPVIFLSALSEPLDKVKAFSVGGVDYVTKPFHMEELVARVTAHLRISHLQREVEGFNLDLEEKIQEQAREISLSQMATILSLSKLAEYRDEETGNHLLRVQRFCRAIAVRLAEEGTYGDRIDETFVDNIFHASPLHDVGKVGIPDRVLLKRGPLTAEEWTVMKGHTSIGAETLETVFRRYPNNSFLRMGIDLARSHHERWDGSGYPEGLAGESIPLPARILILADVYDALRTARPYKPGFDAARTIAILTEGDGRTMPAHFDPRIFAVLGRVAPEFEAIYDSHKDDSRPEQG